ncbi:putative membrane protein [Clostridium sardiniense]|nr:putative membrane protein [Clostridium sardiniense]
MALADSVPGVSGGTIAFILGFYDKFINSLNNVVVGKKEERIDAIKFLIKLGIGWIFGFVLSVLFITSIFEQHIYEISSLFIGFIIVAIPIIFKEERKSIIGKYKNILFLILGIIIVVGISYLNPASAGGEGVIVSTDHLTIGLVVYIFISAMIAISAMVLPGISGSTILLIFGLYAPILGAIKQVIKFNFDYLPIVIIFGLGVLTGIAVTIKGVKYALANYRSQTIYCILGLMIGSLYAVVMGPTSLEVPKAPMDMSTFSIVYFIIGGAIIIGLERLKVQLEKKKIK